MYLEQQNVLHLKILRRINVEDGKESDGQSMWEFFKWIIYFFKHYMALNKSVCSKSRQVVIDGEEEGQEEPS